MATTIEGWVAVATQDDVRRICARLPGAIEGGERFGFGVLVKGKVKWFVWSWAERVHPKKAKVINDNVLAVSTPGLALKDMILASDPAKFFTEPHYDGFAAVLVRLEAIPVDELEDLIIEAWRTKAPPHLLAEFERLG